MFGSYKILSSIIQLAPIKYNLHRPIISFYLRNKFSTGNTNIPLKLVRHYSSGKGFDSKFVIVRVTPKDYENVVEFFRYSFFNGEPSILAAGLAYKQNPILEEKLLEALTQGMSLMALCRRSGNIVGAAVNVGLCPWDGVSLEEFANSCTCPKVAELLRFYAYIVNCVNLFEKYNEHKIFEISYLATDINNTRMGIGYNLAKKAIELAKDLTYNVVRIDATSTYTQRICTKLNMIMEHQFTYKSYVNCDSKPIFIPPPPHETVAVYVTLPHAPKKK